MNWFFDWGKVRDLPPVAWIVDHVLGLGIWNWGPFGWLGAHAPFQDRLPLFFLTALIVVAMVSELIWYRVMVMRAKQIGFDPVAATIWQTGPLKGKKKNKPVDLHRARARQISWPLLGLPLGVIAMGMWIFFLAYPTAASWQLFAALSFFTAPIRKMWSIYVARRAFRATNPDFRIETTLMEDVRDYYQTGFAGDSRSRRPIEPAFETNTRFGRFANWVQMNIRPKRVVAFLLRLLTFRWLWGVVVQLFLAYFVPVAALIAPFWYMFQVEDYEDWMRPWWRWNRSNQTPKRVVVGEAAVVKDETAGGSGTVLPAY